MGLTLLELGCFPEAVDRVFFLFLFGITVAVVLQFLGFKVIFITKRKPVHVMNTPLNPTFMIV